MEQNSTRILFSFQIALGLSLGRDAGRREFSRTGCTYGKAALRGPQNEENYGKVGENQLMLSPESSILEKIEERCLQMNYDQFLRANRIWFSRKPRGVITIFQQL